MSDATLKTTPLLGLHQELGAKIVPFAGYSMPVQFPAGIKTEHLHTRSKAGLFDVSHMGQLYLQGDGIAQALEQLVPADALGLARGRQRYALFTNEQGGIRDDLMIARTESDWILVVNAACKDADEAYLRQRLPPGIRVTRRDDLSLLAIQGPRAAAALSQLNPSVLEMKFMDVRTLELIGATCVVSRSGYTGEDGFEISVPNAHAEELARELLATPEVEPIGLGARDSLRLEAGLPLYGHDLNTEWSPVESNLSWSIGKERRPGGARAGGYPGAETVERHLKDGAPRKRVGLLPRGKAPIREGADVVGDGDDVIGKVTSGGFGPSLGGPLAMAVIDTQKASESLGCLVRGRRLDVDIQPMPFVPNQYRR